jgi:hypothetical protein
MEARRAALLVIALLTPAAVFAQDPAQVQRLFEAGRFQQVVDATTPASPPDALYLAAQSHQKLGGADRAAQTFGLLAQRPEADPWH